MLPLRDARAELLADRELTGVAWCRRWAAACDEWLAELFASVTRGDDAGLTLMAVGGYGLGELAPGSDLDLVLVHDRKSPVAPVAEGLWYPIWDQGIKLDHSVRTPKELRSAMGDDLKVALGWLQARPVAGDAELAARVTGQALDLWRTRAARWLPQVDEVVRQRHTTYGDLAYLLEPDLKEARGGLRDLRLLRALRPVSPVVAELAEDPGLLRAGGALDAVRVELQRSTGRPSNQLLLQEQDVVAAALGVSDADDLMAQVAEAARTVAWASDDAWRRVASWLRGPRGRGGAKDEALEPGLILRDGEVALAHDADPGVDPSLALRAAAASAELHRPLSRATLDRLAERTPAPDIPWPPDLLRALVRLLGTGADAIPNLEALDQLGLIVRLLPEWAAVRNRPQRNAYHRFTVDRHLWEAAVNAAALVRRVARPDLLLLGALLHDIGKGRGGDHTEIGIDLVTTIGPQLGLPPDDVAVLANMVRQHLLLPEVATRRDLDDPRTITSVAEAVGDRTTLELLAALTEADSLATGPSAWGPWKAGLVARLTERVAQSLAGQPLPEPPQPTEAERRLLATGRLAVVTDGAHVTVAAPDRRRRRGRGPVVEPEPRATGTDHQRLTVAVPDRPGLLATVAGVLALAGVTVRTATTRSEEDGNMALLNFDVAPAVDVLPDAERISRDLAAALDGRLPLTEKLAERERHYARRRDNSVTRPVRVEVTVDNTAATAATVVEVRAPDRAGVLYHIASALSGLDLVITAALVSTLGAEVIDAFYVTTSAGDKLSDDPATAEALAAAIRVGLGADGRDGAPGPAPGAPGDQLRVTD